VAISDYEWVHTLLIDAFGHLKVRSDEWNDGQNLSFTVWKSEEKGPDNPYCWLMEMAPEKMTDEVEHNGYVIKRSRPMGSLGALSSLEVFAKQMLPHLVAYKFNDQPERLAEAVEEVEKIKRWMSD
jgi:hypothetical protein